MNPEPVFAPKVFESVKEIEQYFTNNPINFDEFMKLRNNEARVKYILTNVKSKESYQQYVRNLIDFYTNASMKNDETSTTFRNQAIAYMQSYRYHLAIEFFTRAILYGSVSYMDGQVTNTDPLYLAFYHRSLAFIEMGETESALHDTNMCLNIFPTNQMIYQKADCLKILMRYEEAIQVIDEVLTDPRLRILNESRSLMKKFLDQLYIIERSFRTTHQKKSIGYYDLWFSDKVKFVSSLEKGRYLCPKEFIPKNTVYLYEKATHILLLEAKILTYCSNCNKYLKYQIWPCYACNEVVFCDQKCLKEGMKRFHQFECGVTKLFYKFGNYCFQAFRLFLSSGIINANDLCVFRNKVFMNPNIGWNLHNWIENHANQCQPEVKSREESFAEFKAILTFMDNKQNLGSKETKLLFEAIETSVFIEYTKAFRFKEQYEDNYVFIKFVDFLLTQRLKIFFNTFLWRKSQTETIALCFYIMGCFINHSCVPNTHQDSLEQYLKLITTRDVQQWEDLTISYGPNVKMPFFQRQKIFRDICHFQCLCELCLEQVKTVPAVQCLHCDGPVFYSDTYFNDICMKCGQKYEDFLITSQFVENLKNQVIVWFNDIENGTISAAESLQAIEHYVKVLSKYMYRESFELETILNRFRGLQLPFHSINFNNQLREFD